MINNSNPLVVFDRLEVGPVKLEIDRMNMPYRLVSGEMDEQTELVYKFEEQVFEPSSAADLNLAAMMGVQVALNYGLFCHRIVFHGIFDGADQRFIKDMMENTAREIYVLKFLWDNPFLTGEAAKLKNHPEKKKNYSFAQIEFPEQGKKSKHRSLWQLWHTGRHRHAILSSGGKDSLLSTGLLQELGLEVHPLFINESGRHWFTALNGYRYIKENVAQTARTWTNSDRVFNWMLRHMPFIRKDYSRVRSDEYPVRLWTVAVFLFGALPLLKKREIARLIIGDEYDTTVRGSYKGITHYNGLYDQSRFFDNAMSRYFMKKGWNISQFSLLRPLSEMLIQDILVKRYPHLQAHQVSCHAAHKEEENVKPCGRCEKCRRIVGMLKALDADPSLCGYTEDGISFCLEQVASKGVHQESAGGRHLLHLLYKKNILPPLSDSRKIPRPHPEIEHLRFDPERSPIDWIPVDLRLPLFRIFLEHAKGTLIRQGHDWNPFDLLNANALNRPFSFELPPVQGAPVPAPEKGVSQNTHIWGEMTWPDVNEQIEEVDIALLPVGSIEQHGPHLPLDTDAFDAKYLCHQVAQACSNPKPFVLPLLPYGVSYEHDAFKGTVSITNDTLSALVYDVGISLARNGIKKLVIINGHGGNTPALNYAAQMINRDAHIFVCVDSGETSDVDIYKLIHTPNDVHAGEVETSTSLAIRPHLVKMEKAPSSVPRFSSRYLNFTSKRGVQWYGYTQNVSPDGVLGDAARANAEKGRKIWQIMIAHLVALVEDLKPMTLEEIYHKKY